MEQTKDNEVTPEKFAVLAKIAVRLCDMVIMCAPPFAPNSQGAQTLEMAYDLRPKLIQALARIDNEAKGGEANNEDTPNQNPPGQT